MEHRSHPKPLLPQLKGKRRKRERGGKVSQEKGEKGTFSPKGVDVAFSEWMRWGGETSEVEEKKRGGKSLSQVKSQGRSFDLILNE